MSDLTGQTLGQYQILARISKGSTSTIYKAYQPKLDRFVAVKVLSPHVVDEEGFLDRFTQEARAVAQLDHPNIVPVYDFDQVGDIAYIVLKYVESGTLRSMMTGAPLDLGFAVDIVTQVGLALGYAHRRGVVHRDVKPSNILIGEGRWALLTDFGLAKILAGGRKLTRTGIGMGTPDYMSPEQAQGMPGDGRADLYSLGVTLYEMVTGRVPFDAESSMGVVVKHIIEPPPSPCRFNPTLPESVERVILTAIEKDPAKRFQTAEAMVAALVRAAGPAVEQASVSSADVAALSIARMRGAQPPAQPATSLPIWRQARKAALRAGQRVSSVGAQVGRNVKTRVWDRLSRRQRLALGGMGLAAIVLVAVVGGVVLGGPVTGASVPPTSVQVQPSAEAVSTAATVVPVRTSMLTAVPTASPPPSPAVPSGTMTPTPEFVFLPSSAKIRAGIYVKVVRPAGIDLSNEAGFDAEFIATLAVGKILYVLDGPVKANSLSWIKVTDGVVAGWGVQDYVVAYGVKNTP